MGLMNFSHDPLCAAHLCKFRALYIFILLLSRPKGLLQSSHRELSTRIPDQIKRRASSAQPAPECRISGMEAPEIAKDGSYVIGRR